MICFGPSGNSDKFYAEGYKTTTQAFKWLKQTGLNAFEYSFGRGVNMSAATAEKIKQAAQESDVCLSAHAPYYINFANTDDEKITNSINHCIRTAQISKLMGSDRIIIHSATVGKVLREEAFKTTQDNINKLTQAIYDEKLTDINFCFETMGKINQIGTLDEVIKLCQTDDIYYPVIDFGHLNARTKGGLSSYQDYYNVFKQLTDNLDKKKIDNLHIHFSKIEYSNGGEVRHLTFNDNIYGPDYKNMIQCIHDFKLTPRVICESAGTQAEDALEMLTYYNYLLSK